LNSAEMALRAIPPVLEPDEASSDEQAASGRS
jgi:hypothetical protein